MIRNIIGSIVMLFSGLIIIYGIYDVIYGDNQVGAIGAIVILTPIFLSGYWIRKIGKRSRRNNRIVKEYALKKQSEYGFVNALNVPENTQTKMIEATKILKKLEAKNLINIEAVNNSEISNNTEKNQNIENLSNNNKKYESKMKQLNCLLEEDLINEEEYEIKCKEIKKLLIDNTEIGACFSEDHVAASNTCTHRLQT